MTRELPKQAGRTNFFLELNRKEYARFGASFVVAALFSSVSNYWLHYVIQPEISSATSLRFYARFVECAVLSIILVWLLRNLRTAAAATLLFGLSYAAGGFLLSGLDSRFSVDPRAMFSDFCLGLLVVAALALAVRAKGAHRGWIFGAELIAWSIFAILAWIISPAGTLDTLWFISNTLNGIAFGLMLSAGLQQDRAPDTAEVTLAPARAGLGRFGMLVGAALGLDVVLHINLEKFVQAVDSGVNDARNLLGDNAWGLLKSAELSRGFFPAILIGIVIAGAYLGFHVFTYFQDAWYGTKRHG